MSRYIWAALIGSVFGLPATAVAATYNCLPVELLEVDNRVHVQCGLPWQEGGYPRDGANQISYFAVPKSDVDFAKRFVHMMQTAITAGLVVQFQYTSGDISGATFGCGPDNCRKPWAFGLLAPATEVRIPFSVWPSGATESIAQGEWRHYGPFSVSSSRKLVVNMTGTGNADLYVRKDDPPTDADFTCRPLLATSNEDCTVEEAATYYVGVKGVAASSTYKVTVSIPLTVSIPDGTKEDAERRRHHDRTK